jgi:dihydroxyacetone kinase-like predicted kinase
MESLAQFKAFGLGEEHARGIFGRSLRNQEIFSAWMDKRRRLEQAREEDYRDQANEVAESLAIVDDEDHNFSLARVITALEQAREEDYRDQANEVAESLATVDDEDHNSSVARVIASLEQAREEDYRDQANEVAESLAIADDEEPNSSIKQE